MPLSNNEYRWLTAITLLLLVWTSSFAQGRTTIPDATSELEAALIDAKTSADRDVLLEKEKNLVTVDLRKSLVQRAKGLIRDSEYSKAYQVLAAAESVASKIGDKSGTADVLRTTARVDYFLGENSRALEHLHAAVAIFNELRDASGVGRSLIDVAEINQAQGRTADALAAIQEAIRQFEVSANKSDVINALNRMAGIYLDSDQGEMAAQAFGKSLQLDASAANYSKIAVAFYQKLDYDRAIHFYEQALAAFEKERNASGYRDTLSRLATVYSEQGDYELAFEYQIKSLALEQEFGNKESLAAAYMSLGEIYLFRGNLNLAADSYERSLKIAAELGNKVGTGIRLANLGVILELQGNLQSALERYQASLVQLKAADFPKGVARVLSHMGRVYYAERKYSLALSSYQEALTSSQADGNKLAIAYAFLNVGMVQAALGTYSDALLSYQSALALVEARGSKPDISIILANIANVRGLLGEAEQALTNAERAVALASQTSDLDAQSGAWLQEGRAYRALNRPAQAREAFEQSMRAIEQKAALTIGDAPGQRTNNIFPFIAALKLSVDEKRTADAFSYVERAKAQALRDILRRGDTRIVKGEPGTEQEMELKLLRRMLELGARINRENHADRPDQKLTTTLDGELQKTRREYATFLENLYGADPKLGVWRGALNPGTQETINACCLSADVALVEYFVTDDRTYLFVLTGERRLRERQRGNVSALNVYTLPIGERDLSQLVTRLRELIAARDPTVQTAAAELYDLLLRPAQKQLDGKQHLIIVPDAQLWTLPFEALAPAKNRYLIEQSAISYAPSSSALIEMVAQHKERTTKPIPFLLAFGNPVLSEEVRTYVEAPAGPNFAAQSEQEIKAVGDVAAADGVKLYTGREATEENLASQLSPYRILHFATPALFDDASPMYSAIGLSRLDSNKKNDGLLQPREIVELDVKADLVTVSMATSKAGEVHNGDAIIGMSWAWFVAGSSTVLLSQWRHDPLPATALISDFYRGMKSRGTGDIKNRSKAEALRTAILKLLGNETFRAPYYWSGFMLVGDGM
jgi:CHAT domain-containing protein